MFSSSPKAVELVADNLNEELHLLEVETFEIEDIVDVGQDAAMKIGCTSTSSTSTCTSSTSCSSTSATSSSSSSSSSALMH
ncbi:MAG TPA: thiazolylpeptide-type bacteriocin [Ktedonobacteraceae bacterium]|nr:thiazolylpeptide-type bacteriocin [Ktedonobacteraceae bacterium]